MEQTNIVDYLKNHFEKSLHLVIGGNSVEPPSHKKLITLARSGDCHSVLGELILRAAQRAEEKGEYLVFNTSGTPVPEQKEIKEIISRATRGKT